MQVRLTPESMVHGGAALAHLDDGRVALVRGGLPGEPVIAELDRRRGVLQGQVVEVLEASPDRIPAPEHPGLDLGFVRYPRQLELKRAVVEDALSRAGHDAVEVPEVRPAPAVWRYRSAIQPAASPAGLGYRQPQSQQLVLLDDDPTANEVLQEAWRRWSRLGAPKGVRELALRGNDDGEVVAALIASASQRSLLPFAHQLLEAGFAGVAYAQYDPRGRFRRGRARLAGARTIRQRYGRFEVTVAATAFAQPNPAAAGHLFADVETLVPGGDHALDLYAGGGVLGMYLCAGYRRVTAVEIDGASVSRGRRDAERLGLAGLDFIRGDSRELILPTEVDLIAVDPPRAGLNKDVRDAIVASATPYLLYVSCDVATFARDLAYLLTRGFRLEHLQPFDFYPHTHHIEMLALLGR